MIETRRHPGARLAAVLLVLIAVAGVGCTGDADKGAAPGGTPASSTVERGPVRLTVIADRERVTVGQKLTLTIEVVAEGLVEVRMPEVEDVLGPFAVRDARTPPDVPEGARRRWSHVYVLDTFAPGEAEIPSVTVSFVDRRPIPDGATDPAGSPAEDSAESEAPIEGELTSEPLTIVVDSVLAGGEGDADIHDIKGAIDLPAEPAAVRRRWLLAGIGVVVAVVVFLVLLRFFRREPTAAPAPPPVPAHVRALEELDRLERDGLVEARRFHDFYFRLSGVVRQYIEGRFGLMAPERTTEEFLRELGRGAALGAAHKELLTGFLRAADLVKFARVEPSAEESTAALGAARGFVRQTMPDPDGAAAPVDPARETAR